MYPKCYFIVNRIINSTYSTHFVRIPSILKSILGLIFHNWARYDRWEWDKSPAAAKTALKIYAVVL